MENSITWYDVLGVLPTASIQTIKDAYDSKASLLRPETVAGASSVVIAAASRAQSVIDAAWRVLGDPVKRQRYDEAAGIFRVGGGLYQGGSSPSQPELQLSDFDYMGDRVGAEVLGGLMALAEWLTPQPRQPRRIEVPDLRGLFYSECLEIAGRLHLRLIGVRLTEHPRPVEGLIVAQSPRNPTKIRRTAEVTVQVWHPPT